MTITLTPYQVELNCRRLNKFSPNVLVTDENGTLFRKINRFEFCYFLRRDYSMSSIGNNIQPGIHRNVQIIPTVKATLEGMCANMQKESPIGFYVIPEIYNFSTSYESLAHRVKLLFAADPEVVALADRVVLLYHAIDYHLNLPEGLSENQKNQVNRYVTKQILHAFQGNSGLDRKDALAAFAIEKAQEGITTNKIFDSLSGTYKDLDWITSGAWESKK